MQFETVKNKIFIVSVLTLLCLSVFGVVFQNIPSVKATDITFGNTSTGAYSDLYDGNFIIGSLATAPQLYIVNNVSCYMRAFATGIKAKIAIYRHIDLSLYAFSNEITLTTSWAWHNFTFAANPSCSAQEYVLCVWASGQFGVRFDYPQTNVGHKQSATYNGFPDPLVPTHGSRNYCIYASCTIEQENQPPQVSNIFQNTTLAGQPCQFGAYWTTPQGTLSHWIVGVDTGLGWQNTTYAFSGGLTQAWTLYNLTLPSTVGTLVQWKIWANNTDNLWRDTGLQSFIIEGTSPAYVQSMYKSEIRGVFIHEAIYGVAHNWTLMAETFASYGINAVFVSDFSTFGRRPYSEIRAAIDAFHAKGIEYHAAMFVVQQTKGNYGTEAIKYDGTIYSSWSQCPIKVHDYVLSAIQNYIGNFSDVDGIMLDYIRYSDEAVTCYCPYCRAAFEAWLGEGTITNWTPFYPNQARWTEFLEFRPVNLNPLVKDIHTLIKSINPNILISEAAWTLFSNSAIYWRKYMGQDTAYWIKEGYIDFVVPMMYTQDTTGLEGLIDTNIKYWIGGKPEGKIPLLALLDVSRGLTQSGFVNHINAVRNKGLDGWVLWWQAASFSLSSLATYLSSISMPTVFNMGNITVSAAQTQAVVTWATDLATTSKVEYSATPMFGALWKTQSGFRYWEITYANGTIVYDNTNVTSHSMTITGLTPDVDYYFRVQSTGDSGTATSQVFQLTRKPLYSNVAFNTTLAGVVCQFSVKWITDKTLSGAFFSTNNSGTMQDSAWTSLTGSEAWLNVTITLNSTVGAVVQFSWSCNNSDNVWGYTGIWSLTTTSAGTDSLELIAPDEAYYHAYNQIVFTFIVRFANEIQNASLWLNMSGTWQNVGWNATKIENNTNVFVFNFQDYPSATYIWNIQVFSESEGVFAPTNRTVIINVNPQCSSLLHTSETRARVSDLRSEWYDGDGLAGYIVSHTNEGAWKNETWISFTTATANYTLTLNSTYGATIQYKFYVNDTDGRWTISSIGNFTADYIYWSFTFNHTDLQNNSVKDIITWELWYSTENVTYTEGEALLHDGTYTLKTFFGGNLVNATALDTEIFGDNTVNVTLPMMAHASTANGYMAFNKTATVTIISQTATNLTFTATGVGAYLMMISVPQNALYILKDGTNVTDWIYDDGNKLIIIETDSLSEWQFIFTEQQLAARSTFKIYIGLTFGLLALLPFILCVFAFLSKNVAGIVEVVGSLVVSTILFMVVMYLYVMLP